MFVWCSLIVFFVLIVLIVFHGAVKPYKEDKRVLKDITRQYGSDTSPPSSSKSPIGSMKQPSTRKLLSQLIVTLNSSFPDYDFRYSMVCFIILKALAGWVFCFYRFCDETISRDGDGSYLQHVQCWRKLALVCTIQIPMYPRVLIVV